MALAARPVLCQLKTDNSVSAVRTEPVISLPVQKFRVSSDVSTIPAGAGTGTGSGKIVLQPRLCTLRSYGSNRVGLIKSKAEEGRNDGGVPPFFATLSEYIDSSKKSHDLEIISGRLAMIVFAGTVMMEVVTGNSLFRKMDLQGIAEAAGVCLGAVTCAAVFAWFSSARNRVGRIFAIKCNTLIDSLIDQIIDGLFYDTDDWSDEL